jgi:hypothetical protein
VAGATAAAVVVIVVVAVIASALTSGSSTPQAGSGNTGTAAAGTSPGGAPSSASGSAGITYSGSCFAAGQILNGVAALPVSEASVAASIRQQDSSCYGTPISQITVTCGYPYTFTTNTPEPEGTISYTCNDNGQPSAYYVNPASGAWMAQS